MPGILYEIPAVAASNTVRQFAQKGPTCWYYAAKMMLKFHGILDSRIDQVHADWKALSQVRKVFTEVGQDNIKSLKRGNGWSVDVITQKLNQRNNAENTAEQRVRREINSMTKIMQDLRVKISSNTVVGTVRTSIINDISRIVEALQQKEADLRKILAHKAAINAAISRLARQPNRAVDGTALFWSFLPRPYFQPVPTPRSGGWKMTAAELYDILDNYGPVLAGGNVLPTTYPVFNNRRAMVSQIGRPNSGHVVVICGVDTLRDQVLYVDPNWSDSLLVVSTSELLQNVGSVDIGLGGSRYHYVDCGMPDNHGTDICRHVRAARLQPRYKQFRQAIRDLEAFQANDDDWGDFVAFETPLEQFERELKERSSRLAIMPPP